MVITFKIGGCADHMNKKSDLIKKKKLEMGPDPTRPKLTFDPK